MTQETVTAPEQQQDAPVPAEEPSLLQPDGDEPLVPQEPEVQEPSAPEPTAPEARAEEGPAAPPVSDEPAEPSKDEGEAEEPSLTEQVAAEVKKQTAAIQSGYERRRREDEQQIRTLETEREREGASRAVEERTEAHRRELRAWYEGQNIDPAEASRRIEQEATNFRAGLVAQQERETQAFRSAAMTRRVGSVSLDSWATELGRRYNLSTDDQQAIRAYYDAETLPLVQASEGGITLDEQRLVAIGDRMMATAKRLGTATETVREAKRTVQERTPPVTLETGAGRPVQTDDQFLANFSNPDHPENDMTRAVEVLRKRGQSPV